jgi:hypothetical protein
MMHHNRYAIKGHLTGGQMQHKLSGMRMSNVNGVEPKEVVDIPVDEMGIEDVSPEKKEVPFFTKKGKLILAVIVVGSALYYIWQRHQANKGAIETPSATPSATPQPEAPVQATNDVASTASSEQAV